MVGIAGNGGRPWNGRGRRLKKANGGSFWRILLVLTPFSLRRQSSLHPCQNYAVFLCRKSRRFFSAQPESPRNRCAERRERLWARSCERALHGGIPRGRGMPCPGSLDGRNG